MKSLLQYVDEELLLTDEQIKNAQGDEVDEMKWKGRRQSKNVEDRRTNLQKKTTTFGRVASMNRRAKRTPTKNPIPYDDGRRKDYRVERDPNRKWGSD